MNLTPTDLDNYIFNTLKTFGPLDTDETIATVQGELEDIAEWKIRDSMHRLALLEKITTTNHLWKVTQ